MDAPTTPPPPGRGRSEMLKTGIVAIAVALVLRVGLFEPFTIPSASMEPTLLVGDYLVATKFDYGWSRFSIPLAPPLFRGRLAGRAPARGDVIIFRLPRDTAVTYVKRVIGLPGDRVQVIGGALHINGRPVAREPLGPAADLGDGRTVLAVRETLEGRPGFVTFDRGPGRDGDDTRVFEVPAGHYFVMGDNRDNSLDSRWPPIALGVGMVPAENLVGRARFVLASWRPGASLFKPWTWATNLRPDRLLHPL